MPDIYVKNNFYQGTSQAAITDLTPPTFAGIAGLSVASRGQLRASWLAATDPTLPIRYEVYVKASTATDLFNTVNIAGITSNLMLDVWTMPDGSFLVNGTTYYVGVRALDGVSNRDNNVVSLSAISTGQLTSIDVYEAKASFSVDASNQFRITMWANKNESLAKSPDAILGTASFQVYDRVGAPVSGMSGTGITANSEGLFIATPVANMILENEAHYEIKATIVVDGANRTNFISIQDYQEQYQVNGTGAITSTNDIIGSFWVSENEKIVTTNLGTGSYQVYTADGTPIVGFAESGITADSNGFFKVTPLPLPPTINTTQPTVVKYSVVVNGVTRSHNVVFDAGTVTYSNKATFSINGLNQLEATFWCTINEALADPALLGTASYTVYDKSGVAVSGLTQSGITKDAQGLFHITPVSAALLSDLTHYTVKVTIMVAGKNSVSVKGFTLLGN